MGREHHVQLILNYFTQNISEYGHEYHNYTLQTSPRHRKEVTQYTNSQLTSKGS